MKQAARSLHHERHIRYPLAGKQLDGVHGAILDATELVVVLDLAVEVGPERAHHRDGAEYLKAPPPGPEHQRRSAVPARHGGALKAAALAARRHDIMGAQAKARTAAGKKKKAPAYRNA